MLWLNGTLHAPSDSVLPLSDRAFLLGDGLFESILLRNGQPIWFAEHWARLSASAAWAMLPLAYSAEQIHAAIVSLASTNKLSEGVARITLSRGPGARGLALPEPCNPNLVISTSPMPPALPAQGIALAIASETRSTGGQEWSRKAMHFLPSIREMELARQKSCHDSLWLSANGYMLESTMANLFWIANGTLFTPPVNGSILPGIARAKVLQIARAHNMPVQESESPVAALQGAQSVFLTNSARGIIPVALLENEKVGGAHPWLKIFQDELFVEIAKI